MNEENLENVEKIDRAVEFMNSFRGQYIIGQALTVAIESMENRQPEWKREPSNVSDMQYMLTDGPIGLGLGQAANVSNPLYDSYITVRIRDGKNSEDYETYEDNYVNDQIAIEVAKALDFVFRTTSHLWAEVVYEMIPIDDEGEYFAKVIYPVTDESE